MTHYLQTAAGVLLAVILCLTLGKQSGDLSALLSIAVSCMVILSAVCYLQPVMDFLKKLESLGNLNGEMIDCLFKVAGIGMITEISALVCSDAGNSSLGKSLQLLGSAVILWLSVPVFTALMDLIQKLLGDS